MPTTAESRNPAMISLKVAQVWLNRSEKLSEIVFRITDGGTITADDAGSMRSHTSQTTSSAATNTTGAHTLRDAIGAAVNDRSRGPDNETVVSVILQAPRNQRRARCSIHATAP